MLLQDEEVLAWLDLFQAQALDDFIQIFDKLVELILGKLQFDFGAALISKYDGHVVRRIDHYVNLRALSHAIRVARDELVDLCDAELPSANLGVDAIVDANFAGALF